MSAVAADQLLLRGRHDTLSEHPSSYGEIDIALDTFPYNGTTTTCEALWMGVPVVTLAGDRHAARVGASLLSNIQLSSLIASSVDEYVRIASQLASDQGELTRLRHSLRDRISRSPLCNARGFARDVESAYRTLWKSWCDDQRDGRKHDTTPAAP